ncbi:hypothetical protein ABT381_27915, partial [Streptomyces sp. NPDC000151]
MSGALRARLTALLTAAGVARTAYEGLRRRPPGGTEPWRRKNHAGRSVDLFGGPAAAVGAAAAVAAAHGLPDRARTA